MTIYNPVSTYRIQFNRDFTLKDAEKIIPYLEKTGIRCVYASPIFQSVSGSMHGYDVTDPGSIDREIGTEKEFTALIRKLKKAGIGWIQDIVPNHMAFSTGNPWISDLLQKGEKSPYRRYFDLFADDPLQDGKDRLLLPFFGKDKDELIAGGELKLEIGKEDIRLQYYDTGYPLSEASLSFFTGEDSGKTQDHHDLLKKIPSAVKDCSSFSELAGIPAKDKEARNWIEARVKEINDNPEQLATLISLQHYEPVHWKTTEKRIGYRRFFTINGLICLQMQDEEVFDQWHAMLLHWIGKGWVDGLRVDHIDGLYDPGSYLGRLREKAGGSTYIVVEKILEEGESLPADWSIQGTTGYDFLALVNNLLTNEGAAEVLHKYTREWSGDVTDFRNISLGKKRFILHERLGGELRFLASRAQALMPENANVDANEQLQSAIGEFLVHCPVYKIYHPPSRFTDEDRALVDHIIADAKEANPAVSGMLETLHELFSIKSDHIYAGTEEADDLFMRCMQFSGPLMAKGIEDTLFYSYNPFIAHNEVGDSPGYFGIPTKSFHGAMSRRLREEPLTMNATSTHDTKRGADARARLNVLSDIPEEWIEATRSWRKMNSRFRRVSEGREIPTRNDEYFIYQSLFAHLPMDAVIDNAFIERFREFIVKALREAKVNSSWSDPNVEYEQKTIAFTEQILSLGTMFLGSLYEFVRRAIPHGINNSLTQLILRNMVPGVPDNFQGSERWNLDFVDPDNRTAVDFVKLSKELDGMLKKENTAPSALLSGLLDKPEDGRIKQWVNHKTLDLRARQTALFEKGAYLPLEVKGEKRRHVIAFCRQLGDEVIVVILPLHTASMGDELHWGNTRVIFPELFPHRFRDIFTGQLRNIPNSIRIEEAFRIERPAEKTGTGNNDTRMGAEHSGNGVEEAGSAEEEAGHGGNGDAESQEKAAGGRKILNSSFCVLQGIPNEPRRRAGVLMHITSLPGDFGTGDFGRQTRKFIDFLHRTGQRTWQVLPLNVIEKRTSYSPYSSASAFAGNELFIDSWQLAEYGLLSREEIKKQAVRSKKKTRYSKAAGAKKYLIRKAFETFIRAGDHELKRPYLVFLEQEQHWLDDYALFSCLKDRFKGKYWNRWPEEYRDRRKQALKSFAKDQTQELELVKFTQFLFMWQWREVKQYANDRGIEIFGDIPIYIDFDSADVWAHPELFQMNEKGEMTGVAGVPPDYFNENGQHWGMPLYDWEKMEKEKFGWWMLRLRKNLEYFDLLRLDHFRGFSAYWHIPAGAETAREGQWVKAPGVAFFDAVKSEFPEMPFVAEDLGMIDEAVYELRDRYALPGMKVVQFGFGGDAPFTDHHPLNIENNSIAYTGTHDNNTVTGWFRKELDRAGRKRIADFTGRSLKEKRVHLDMIRIAYAAKSRLVIVPLQDWLGLDENSRMNFPSKTRGNWTWKLKNYGRLNDELEDRMRKFVHTYGRY